jgi:pyruvate,orthophosphate dikinase
MVPLVVDAAELVLVRSWIQAEVEAADALLPPVPVGTMVETPRAALLAGALAAEADFFSFGTNDLTQLVFGFSRDDLASRVVGPYVAQGLLEADPFTTVDDAVGALVATAVAAGRVANPTLEVGVCGEHGGDPASIATFAAAGVDYVSCSAPRVPMARLAAAHAVIGRSSGGVGGPSGTA